MPHGQISADSPIWDEHSGGDGHTAHPEWGPHDTREAAALYASTTGTPRAILDVFIDNPGRGLTFDEIADMVAARTGVTMDNAHVFTPHLRYLQPPEGQPARRYPFTWWRGAPSTYAMRPHVADLFAYARALTERSMR